ncbi:hypothetical protein TrLO_g9718 [Triparma laevis f. longispina]|uniref:Uncharacterized protein n=1 Tax=Triparma laevis f. longispina TaxID=1714387 RepID=A0A9W6ZZ09_9STRA|nr:hypothetical protein TrLO_g9718 [Triparma laevis f. longispina]
MQSKPAAATINKNNSNNNNNMASVTHIPPHIAAKFSSLKALKKESEIKFQSCPTSSTSTSSSSSQSTAFPSSPPLSPLSQKRLVLGVQNVVSCNDAISRMEREIREMEEELERRKNV